MPMSRDRVRFVIKACKMTHQMKDILKDIFDINSNEIPYLDNYEAFEIICRPSQFARFIIARCNAGMQNGIKELEAVCFVDTVPCKPPKKINVSDRKAKYVRNRDYA